MEYYVYDIIVKSRTTNGHVEVFIKPLIAGAEPGIFLGGSKVKKNPLKSYKI